ncbi:unnamed protein product [Rhizopus stolonifer]
MMLRIYRNFIEENAPMKLNVSTKKEVKDKINSLQWAIISCEDALSVLNSTEQEVLAFLVIVKNCGFFIYRKSSFLIFLIPLWQHPAHNKAKYTETQMKTKSA